MVGNAARAPHARIAPEPQPATTTATDNPPSPPPLKPPPAPPLWPRLPGRRGSQAPPPPPSPLAQSLIEKYGPYVPPSLARAQRHRAEQCNHHVMFSLFRTSLSDLSEFGTGHQLYFMFLRYTAVAFAALAVVLGAPLVVAYATNGSFFSSGIFRKATLGHYGPVYAQGAGLADGVVRAPGCHRGPCDLCDLGVMWYVIHVSCFVRLVTCETLRTFCRQQGDHQTAMRFLRLSPHVGGLAARCTRPCSQ